MKKEIHPTELNQCKAGCQLVHCPKVKKGANKPKEIMNGGSKKDFISTIIDNLKSVKAETKIH